MIYLMFQVSEYTLFVSTAKYTDRSISEFIEAGVQIMDRNGDGSRTLSKYCDLIWVTAKSGDVVLHPLQGCDLVGLKGKYI